MTPDRRAIAEGESRCFTVASQQSAHTHTQSQCTEQRACGKELPPRLSRYEHRHSSHEISGAVLAIESKIYIYVIYVMRVEKDIEDG